MVLIKRTIKQEVLLCDDCDNRNENSAFYKLTTLQNCYICGKDLCAKHTYWLGGVIDGIALCKIHKKEIWKFMKKLKTKNGED